MTTDLQAALAAIASMQHPSIAAILKKHGYAYEAMRMEDLIDLFNKEYRHV